MKCFCWHETELFNSTLRTLFSVMPHIDNFNWCKFKYQISVWESHEINSKGAEGNKYASVFYKLRKKHSLLPFPIIPFAPAQKKNPQRWIIYAIHKYIFFHFIFIFCGISWDKWRKNIVCKMFYQTLPKGCQHLLKNLLGQLLSGDYDFYIAKD